MKSIHLPADNVRFYFYDKIFVYVQAKLIVVRTMKYIKWINTDTNERWRERAGGTNDLSPSNVQSHQVALVMKYTKLMYFYICDFCHLYYLDFSHVKIIPQKVFWGFQLTLVFLTTSSSLYVLQEMWFAICLIQKLGQSPNHPLRYYQGKFFSLL